MTLCQFTMVMNIFSCILRSPPTNFKFHWCCKDLGLSHLVFADDVVLFSHGDKASISHIMNSLNKFSIISGLRPSLHKGTCFLNNCEVVMIKW